MSVLLELRAGTQTAQGTLVSVNCGGKDKGTLLAIQNSDGTLNFHSAGAHMIGYSDTLWFGGDHFAPCHHLDGLRAIVRYKPSADKQLAGEWVELDLREDLPGASDEPSVPSDKASAAPAAPADSKN
jgi:hypothetical protein